jgi:hypothetical protein
VKASSIRFQCPSCRQKLSIQPEYSGQSIACPSCGKSTTVPVVAQRGVILGSKVAAAGLFLAILGGAVFFIKGRLGESNVSASSGSATTLADQIHGKPIKRSGSANWEVAFAYYAKALGASQIMFSSQEQKGKLAILPGRLVVDQVGDGFIMASHTGSREQWVLHPDNPKALDDIALPEETSIAQLVGVYAGPEQMEAVDGAPRRIPAMIVFGMLTSKGYLDFEAPGAARASAEELRPYADAQATREAQEKAKEKAELDAREAERQKQRAKDIAELEQDPSWNPKAKPRGAGDAQAPGPIKNSTDELAKARADLSAVKLKLENARTLGADAPELEAEKRRLQGLVDELDPEIQE